MKLILWGDSLFARHEGQDIPHINHSLLVLRTDLQIENRAVSGDNSYDLLKWLEEAEDWSAARVFVLIGANDLAMHKQIFLGEYLENLRKIAGLLKDRVEADKICFLSPPPVDEELQAYRTNRLVDYYTEIVEQVAKEEGIDFLSTRAVFEKSGLPVKQILRGQMNDGLHFGSSGYALLAQAMLECIEK
ncbi:GDSL-type esterase/lipase family protein [Streptococcus gallinaceus]|uniref:Lysophospholipase L1-like esterase n=1 Tax=Streptococcus gallinaceus TaxID=165758 RepID=A0ABV2JM47_9STRE